MAEETPVAYKLTAKRGTTVVLETVVKPEDLRGLVKTLNAELLDVETTPLNKLPEGLA